MNIQETPVENEYNFHTNVHVNTTITYKSLTMHDNKKVIEFQS